MTMKKISESSYIRILGYAHPYMTRLLAALFCMLISSACNVAPPWLLKNVVDDVLIKGDLKTLNLLSLGLVVLFVFKGVAGYGHQYLMTWVGQRVIMDLRLRLYNHMQRLSFRYFSGKRVGELLSRVTNDVNVLQDVTTNVVVNLIVQTVTFLGILGFLIYLNWQLTLVTFGVLPAAILAIQVASKRLRRVGHDIQEQLARLSAIAEEALSAIRIVRAFATEDEEFERFRQQNRANFKALMRGTQIHAALSGVVEVILIIALAVILWLGGRAVIGGGLTPGGLIAFLGYLILLVQPIRILSKVVSQLQKGLAAADRVFEVIDMDAEIESPRDPVVLDEVKGRIRFNQVCFAYEKGQPVLSGIDLEILPGETLALVGSTGAGKSTLADMVPRFYDPLSGRVEVDGHDLRRLDLKTLRRRIGIVPQDPVLLSGTLAYNIAYGYPQATQEQIERAARVAGIHEHIVSLPKGYDTMVGQRGLTLSGGQRQRVAIARALIKDPIILIMDEATSSLDVEVEKQVQEAMNKASVGRTSLVIAHRLSTIRNADRIAVLEKGRVVELGSHEDLLALGGAYSRLYGMQFRRDDDEMVS